MPPKCLLQANVDGGVAECRLFAGASKVMYYKMRDVGVLSAAKMFNENEKVFLNSALF